MSMNVNPLALIAGTAGVPILANAVSRSFLTSASPEASLRNIAMYNALLAAVLGYVATRDKLNTDLRSAALGGAVGAGLLAVELLVLRDSPVGVATGRQLGAGALSPTPTFVSHLFGTR